MKIQRIIYLLIIAFIVNSCNSFNKNDFVKSDKIYEIEERELFYELYQTGIDNFRYEFKVIYKKDTIKLFNAYLNDATAKNSSFTIENKNGIININSNKPIGNFEKTEFGMNFKLNGIR